MQVVKDRKHKTLDIHFDCGDKIYAHVSHGVADEYQYGTTYVSLSSELAIDLANQILSKYKVKK